MRNPMLDSRFLRELDKTQNKNIYAKIILLTKNEEPMYEIQGKITNGSINIDGASAVRRTCSLTMVAPDVDINNTYWALKNKFKLEVGVDNTIDDRYPDIIWFKQGIYVFSSLSMSVSTNNFTINISGKDKMCLLNGEIGGTLNSSIDFGQIEEYNTLPSGEITREIKSIPIVDIIKNAIHVYGGESLHNIVLNDIDDYGLELLEYRANSPLYMPRNIRTGEVTNMTINGLQSYYTDTSHKNTVTLGQIQYYYNRVNINSGIAGEEPDVVYDEENNAYNIIKIEFGDTAGYRKTDLTYPGELVGNVGETLVSVLDKIKNMFSDFEYFYDLDGRFVFQKKKTYMNESWNNLQVSDNKTFANNAALSSEYSYSFEDGFLLTAISSSPTINEIKNDYSIWGKKISSTGAELPIHLRYAIDYKPEFYRNFNGKVFTSAIYDWREIIYQMALDYFKYNNTLDDFNEQLAANNYQNYLTGVTGYEMYYTDLQGFWRQLYHPGMFDYSMFSQSELEAAARAIILEERAMIEQEDISQLFIDYLYEHYEELIVYDIDNGVISGALQDDGSGNITIDEGYLNYLFTARQKKINNFTNESTKVVSNNRFLWIVCQAIRQTNGEKEQMKDKITELMEYERNKSIIDFSAEMINYVYDNYEDISMFGMLEDGTIYIDDSHIKYLSLMRDEKLYEMANDNKYIETNTLLEYIAQSYLNSDTKEDYKTLIQTKMDQANETLTTDYSQEIVDYIYNNYKDVVEFVDGVVASPIEILPLENYTPEGHDKKINYAVPEVRELAELRQKKIETFTQFKVFISNYNFMLALGNALETAQMDKEKFKTEIETALKNAITTEKILAAKPIQTVVFKTDKFEEMTEEQVQDKVLNGKEEIKQYYGKTYDAKGWNRQVTEAPELLNFWFDFMNAEGGMGKYAISVVGHRPKAVNDDKVKAIYFEETPTVLFITSKDEEDFKNNVAAYQSMTGYTLVRLSENMQSYFTISAQGKSAWDELNSLLYQHTCVPESLNLTTLPIYYLQPNTRIFVKDDNIGVNGEYILTKISLPLQYNGTSSLTTTRAVERIY